ncbi:MAG: hypothetical protein WCK36_04105, partial [Candidatus Firestonebacteria bacterium]
MKKLQVLILLSLLASGFAFGGEDEFRKKYSDAYYQMQEFHKGLYIKETIQRVGRVGLGISGNFNFDIDWTVIRQSELRQGYFSVSADYWCHPVFNLFVEGGFNRSPARDVWTVSAMVQLVGPSAGSIEQNPNGTGFELGFK